ncbi:MAG: hypothetical protein DLM69_09145 [Candidatus Chloroheliales bacterium]|nr:MAG: hypothetical protein DLM69_09145 [Chloroflexota bacterium]
MRKLGTVSLIAIVTILLFSSVAASTHSQAISGASAKVAPADCTPSWSVVTSPSPGTTYNNLLGVTAISPSDVWAVGYYSSTGTYSTLAEHWNGTGWNVVTSPSPGSSTNNLRGVTAITPSDVWAVGYYASGGVYYTLVEHWNGTSWSAVTSPNPGTTSILYGVTAISPSDVWAVGYYVSGGHSNTLVEHWNGTNWSVVTSPNLGTDSNGLVGVTAISPSDIWAAGYYLNTGGIYQTLVGHWNGTSWSVVTSPSPGTTNNGLVGVTAISPSDVWAVGYYASGSVFYTLVEHWNGTSWSVVTSPNPGTTRNGLYGVTAISPSDVWAVGYYASGGPNSTLVEHWDGTSWSVVTNPNPGTDIRLWGVTAISSSDVWAVGYSDNNTLVEHYSTSGCPTNTPVPPTNTPGGPTDTPAPTNTPLPPTNTPLPTQTPGGPTATPMPTVTPTDCPNPFMDINGNVFYYAIHYLYCRGVVNGTDPTHYSPAGTSTRGQFAKVVVLGFGTPFYTPPGRQDFTDVPPGYFAYVYIETGFHAGILSGFDANGCTAHGATYPCYLPNIPITRGQLTKLVVGAAHYPLYTPTGGNPTFSDVPANNIFFAFIETAHYKGVINGYPDGTFRPNNNIRRDEMAQIVYKGVTTP